MIIIGSISFVVTSNWGRRSSNFRITDATKRHFAHNELTQDKIDCSLVDCITVAQGLQPCPHFVDGMDITIKYLLLQWLCHFPYVLDWWHLSSTIHPVRPSIRGRENCGTVRCRYLSRRWLMADGRWLMFFVHTVLADVDGNAGQVLVERRPRFVWEQSSHRHKSLLYQFQYKHWDQQVMLNFL